MSPMTDLLLALAQVVGPLTPRPHDFDGAPDFPEPDLFVSESEARWMQQRADNWTEREWRP